MNVPPSVCPALNIVVNEPAFAEKKAPGNRFNPFFLQDPITVSVYLL